MNVALVQTGFCFISGSLTFHLLLVQLLEKGLRCHRLGLQVHDLEQHIELMFKLTALHDQENKRMQK